MKEGHKNTAKAFSTRGVRLMCGRQDTLFTPVLPFTRPPVESQHVRSHNLMWKKNVTFPPPNIFLENRPMTNFSSRSSNLTAIDFRQKDWKFCKISVLKPLFSMKIRSQAPTFMAIFLLISPKVRESSSVPRIFDYSWWSPFQSKL